MLRFAVTDAWRLVSRPPSLVIIALMSLAVVAALALDYSATPVFGDEIGWYGSLAHGTSVLLAWIIGLVPGVIGAGALVLDRQQRIGPLIVSRGVPVGRYIVARAVSMFLSSAAGAAAVGLIGLLAGAVLLPHRPARAANAVGPLPELFVSLPFANDLAYILLLAMGCGGLACMGLVVGQIVGSPHLTAATPFAAVLASLFLLEGAWRVVSPFTYLELASEYPQVYASATLQLMAGPVYWAVITVIFIVVSTLMLRHSERL